MFFEGEQEFKAWANILDCNNNNVVGTAFIDATAVMSATFTGTGTRGNVNSFPSSGTVAAYPHNFGRVGYVLYTSTGSFRHYKTWFEATPEPSRVKYFRTPVKFLPEEGEIKTVKGEIDCYGGTVTGVVYVDSTAVSTATITGSGQVGFVKALPVFTCGRSVWVVYSASTVFKPYATDYDIVPEPPRVKSWRTESFSFPSEQIPKTWMAILNPLGTCTGTLRANGTQVCTETFTGLERKTFNVGVDISSLGTGRETSTVYDVVYTGTADFKHYDTKLDCEPMPFGKKTWQITYKKPGGVTQLDMARYWSLDLEPTAVGTATVTSVWWADEAPIATYTHTFTGREWKDRISFPPGARGYLFKQHLISTSPVHVWRVNLDLQRVGVKGFSRVTYQGGQNGN
jgi:hypothetical protein